jgi:Kef-type K+ transport system membrane component KefB
VLFVITGASMPLHMLALGGFAAVAVVFARAAGKMLGVLLVAPFGGLRLRQTAGLGMALLPMSSLTLLLQHDIARMYPEYGLELQAALMGAIIIMEIVGPVAVEAGLRLAGDTVPEERTEPRANAA